MRPTYADFTCDPPRRSNARVEYVACTPADCLHMANGGVVTLTFEVDDLDEFPELTLTVRALVSRLGRHPGAAPLDVVVNGRDDRPVIAGWAIPGGGDLPHDNVFVVPVRLLRKGANTLTLRSSPLATSMLWLYAVLLDPVYQRNLSDNALRRATMPLWSTAYRTELCLTGARTWEPAPDLRFRIKRADTDASIDTLAWRDQAGTESVIACSPTRFIGSRRLFDGRLFQYRGRETADPVGGPAPGRDEDDFTTRHSWGEGWHRAGPLAVDLDDGGAALTSLSWTDSLGNRAAVLFSADSQRFTGVYRRNGEGAIGFQGRR